MFSEKKCKICGSSVKVAFGLPKSKLTGHEIPNAPDDCNYYQCESCDFLFADIHDNLDHTNLYDDSYWDNQDPDWTGRVNQTLRLVLMAQRLLPVNPWELKVLDFGCGMGTFVDSARNTLQMQAWGTDIINPKFGKDWFLSSPPKAMFDVVVACEVIEHLPDPIGIIGNAISLLRPGGIFAFQTAEYNPRDCDRNWWYLGPANGHISLYSRKSFDVLAKHFSIQERLIWNDYPGLQAWKV